MVEIAPQTYEKLEKLFDAAGPQSARSALVTEKGGVYSSNSLAGRFLRLIGIAKPVQTRDLEQFFGDKLRSLGLVGHGAWSPSTPRDGTGSARLRGDAFKQFKMNTVEPHNVRMRETFNESASKIRNLTKSMESLVTDYHKSARRGHNVSRLEMSIRELSGKLDNQVDNMIKAEKGLIGRSEKRPEIPSDLLLEAATARWVAQEVTRDPEPLSERRTYADDMAREGKPLPNAADFEPHKIHEAAERIIDSCERKGAQQAKDEEQRDDARWRSQQQDRDNARDEFRGWRRGGTPGAGASSGPKFHGSQRTGSKQSEFTQKITSAMRTLGLEPSKMDYTEKDITKAYKMAALESHPDKAVQRLPDTASEEEKARVAEQATEKAKSINDARDTLLGVADWYFRSK